MACASGCQFCNRDATNNAPQCRAVCPERDNQQCQRDGASKPSPSGLVFCVAHFNHLSEGWKSYMEHHPEKAAFLWGIVYDKIRKVPSVHDQWPEGYCNLTTIAVLHEIAMARKPWKFTWKHGRYGKEIQRDGKIGKRHFWLFDHDAKLNVDLTAGQFPTLKTTVWVGPGPDQDLPYQVDPAPETDPAVRGTLAESLLEYLAQSESQAFSDAHAITLH